LEFFSVFVLKFKKRKTRPKLESKQKKSCLVTNMARQNLRNLLLIASLFIAAFLSESPRQHVEARTLLKREVESTTTTVDSGEELTTKSLTTTEVQQIPTVAPTTSASIIEATTTVAPEVEKKKSLSEETSSSTESTESHR
jgi:hypothetical protein